MVNKKPDKYLPKNQTWYKIDVFPNCTKKVIICSKCKHKGHISIHLNQTRNKKMEYNPKTGQIELWLQRDFYIHHSHFIADLDRGRHVRCKIGKDHIPISDPNITSMYRLKNNRDLPEWVRDELDE